MGSVSGEIYQKLRGGAAASGVQYPQTEGVYPMNADTSHGNYLQKPNILVDTIAPSPLLCLPSSL